jgi:hypothetical protein
MVYRLAWRARDLLRPADQPGLPPAHAQATCCVGPFPAPSTAHPKRAPAPAAAHHHPFGVTVIGYVQAESGVGESARATLRALACT